MREMVQVILYDDCTYEVNDIDPHHAVPKVKHYHAVQHFYGSYNKTYFQFYYCPKDKWEKYLVKMLSLSTKDIDKKIRELKKQKKEMEKLKEKFVKIIEEKRESK